MTRQMLSDAEWAALKDKLQAIGRIWKHGDEARNRRFLAGVFYLLRTGLAWADLPVEFGNGDAVRKRSRRWCKAGIWQRLFEGTVAAELVDKLLLDGTICKAHRCASGARGGAAVPGLSPPLLSGELYMWALPDGYPTWTFCFMLQA